MREPACLRLFLLILLGAALHARPAAAEGSPEFDIGDSVNSGLANDQQVHNGTQLFVDILNVGGDEKICWTGSGSVTVYRPAPNGNTAVGTLANNNCTGALTTTGAYRIALNNSQANGTRWEVRVCAAPSQGSPTDSECRNTSLSYDRKGRLWSTEWSFQSNTSFAANRSNNGSVYAIVPGGDVGRDAVIEMQMRGVSGAYYRLFANSIGPQTSGGVRVGRSVPKSGHAVAPQYRLYLNPPESAQYNWIAPQVTAVQLGTECGTGIVLDTAEGSVTFNSNVTGQYVLVCDVNKDGIYDLASGGDFSSFGNATMGANTVHWNGKTNAGGNAAPDDYNCVIRLNVGEFHYMADDIETSFPGIRMFRVEANKTTRTPIQMYWDDTAIPNDTETMNGISGVFSPSAPPPAGLNPGAYANASAAFYYIGGNTNNPTGNARAWGNFDGDGKGDETYLDTFASAATMQSPPFVVSVYGPNGDEDGDGLDNAEECAIGTDPNNPDTDGDGSWDGVDDDPLVPSVCSDSDNDGCDDCALGPQDPLNDGPDTDGDGQCDNGDPDGDTVPNIEDIAPHDPLRCRDLDGDGCDDCSAGSGPNVGNDGPDKDADTICDRGDADSDNDGLSDVLELGGVDLSGDADNDGIPDYRDTSYVTCVDVAPVNGECDTLPASVDADGDGIPNHLDRDSDKDGITDAREAGGVDADGDGMPDGCLPVTANGACSSGLITVAPNTDAPSDALPDFLDTDSDGDGISDHIEAFDSNGDGVADVMPSNNDTDGDGIDDAFDPSCIPASNCGGTLGQPVTSPLSAARDSNGDGIPDWLQVCGDAYVTSEACDDGNNIDDDACSNSCLRGKTISCTSNAQCASLLCDGNPGTCQACVDDQGSGTDTGCGGAAPTCDTSGSVNICVVCADTQAGVGVDDGCGAGAPVCDASASGGLGACVECLNAGHCDDSNACTTDSCNAGACENDSITAGTACSGTGVCDGAASAPQCVTCVDNAGVGQTDAGCGGGAPACDTSGATPVCVACVADGDCASGVCGSNNTCVTCEDSTAGSGTDHGCGGATPLCDAAANSGQGACVACFDDQTGDATDVGCGGATPVCNPSTNTCATCLDAPGDDDIGCSGASAMCNTSANAGLGACVECLNAGHCDDSNACTTDSCNAGACENDSITAGTACSGGGVCDGAASTPQCVTCVDNAGVGQTDAGCGGGTPACDTSGATPVCVACVADGDCASGVCGSNNTCVTCEDSTAGSGTDHGCGGTTPLCDAAANGGLGTCVACFDDQTGDATDVGCGGATPVCNPSTNTCATCLDAPGDDDIGCSGASAMCNTSASGGLGACVECLNAGHCDDSNACTTDSCNAGACENDSLSAGTACSGGGVCDGAASTPQCITCLDDAAPDAVDSGCTSGAPLCDTSGASPVCVECLGLSDCALGKYCDASNTCVAGCGADADCAGFPETPLCETGDSICVECLQDGDCPGFQVCGASHACSAPDSDLDGVDDYADLDDDNDGISDADELGGVDLSLDSDGDGVPDYLDPDSVACDDVSPADGICDALPEWIDADGDGIPNHLDRDSDGDGLTDAREASDNDDDGDGVPDDCLPVGPDGACQGGLVVPANSDTDPTPDFLDLDSDGDGLLDHDEAFDTDGDGVSDLPPTGNDTNGDGIDDAFDAACATASDCDGVIGVPVLGVLTASQDSDGDGVPNWLQVCGDGYVTSGEVCDDGDGLDGNACDNACLLGLGETCGGDDECGSTMCDPELGTCQGCLDDAAGGTDSGCFDAVPTCATVGGQNACVVCHDDQADGATDDGCDADAPRCDAAAASGLGACIQCFAQADCDDGNACTSDACNAGACANSAVAAGTACASGVCDGTAAVSACVTCIDDAAAGGGDSGCSGATPTCDVSGAAPSCVACVADADCASGVCVENACVACANDASGAGQDRGCTSAAPYCTSTGGVPACVECVASSDCAGGYCSGGACVPGCASDADCAGQAGTPRCDTASNACVQCLDDGHCPGQMLCSASATCVFVDTDGDGLPDDIDEDDDGDGILDRDELGGLDLSGDEDGDGIPDYNDPDTVSCRPAASGGVCRAIPAELDIDGDGIPNHLDLDSDGDGVPDATEGHDADLDGVPDRTPSGSDSDGDGLDDAFDPDCRRRADCGGVIGVRAPRPDTDGDGQPNFLDADDDGDGRSTADEREDARDYEGDAEDPADIDGDGARNWYDTDSDGDGALDVTENMNGGDANDDGLLDYLDPAFRATDTDGDGVLDVVECPAPAHPDNNDCPDTDGDGAPDYDDTDDDGDGIPTATELTLPQGRDVDGDGVPNYLDTDDDDDGVPTRDELGPNGEIFDTDQDGVSNPYDDDDDNDGIPTARELDDDGRPMDTDGDGRLNHLDTDDDDDTIPTRDEIAEDGSFLDTDDDGIPNHLDPDDDGDGIPTADETGDANGNGVPDYLEPYVAPRGTLAGGALCAVSRVGDGGGAGGGLASALLLGFGLLLGARLRAQKKKRHAAARAARAAARELARAALTGALVLAAAALLARPASAQVAVDQFKPAPLASDGFALSRPDVLAPGAWGLVLMLDYANDPLVFELTPGDPDSERAVIGHHLVGHVGAAVGIWDRFTIFGMLPIHLVMSGDDSTASQAPQPEGAGIGDLAFGGRLLLLGTATSTGALAVELIARVPTAELANGDQSYSGDAIGSYEPALVGELRAGRFDARLRAGARLREPRTVGNLRLDHEFVYGVGARYRVLDALYGHAEVYGSTFIESAFAREQTPLEALLGAKYQPSDFHFGVAAGPGILRGYGSPDVRIVASIGYAPIARHQEPVDTDGDGLFDHVDACPNEPEDKDGFEDEDGCPDPDNDKDGIPDARDKCINDPEDLDGFEDEDGCPDPDNDKDGIPDARDKCINDPEDTDDFEDEDGCPEPDNDKDGIPDVEDNCPNEPEDFDGFEDHDGCPEPGSGKVKVTCEKIDLQDKVFFDTGSDRIQERSYPLLDQVVSVLQAAKHIQRMRIEGHTDSRGNDAKNLELSKRRAASVVRYLVEHGVAESRLESEGYGETKPIRDNKTAAGRGENRRVEFVIVAQDASCAK